MKKKKINSFLSPYLDIYYADVNSEEEIEQVSNLFQAIF
jgi:hypothetical protein